MKANQGLLFKQKLSDLVNMEHPLVKLADQIDWEFFDDQDRFENESSQEVAVLKAGLRRNPITEWREIISKELRATRSMQS